MLVYQRLFLGIVSEKQGRRLCQNIGQSANQLMVLFVDGFKIQQCISYWSGWYWKNRLKIKKQSARMMVKPTAAKPLRTSARKKILEKNPARGSWSSVLVGYTGIWYEIFHIANLRYPAKNDKVKAREHRLSPWYQKTRLHIIVPNWCRMFTIHNMFQRNYVWSKDI